MSTRSGTSHLASSTLLLLFAVLTFFPTLSFDYFFNDDYVLAEAVGAKCNHREFVYWGWNRQLGRPLGNYLQCLGLAPVTERAGFKAGRLLELFFIYTFSLLVYAFLVHNAVPGSSALILAAICTSLPGYWYLSALLAGINNVAAYGFAALSAVALLLGLTREQWSTKRRRAAYAAGFVSAALAAFSYQTALMLVLSLFALPLLLHLERPVRTQLRMLGVVLGVVGAVTALYLAWYIGSGNYGRLAGDPYWGAPADFVDRLAWFFDTVLPAAASLQLVYAPKTLVILLCILLVALLGVAAARRILASHRDTRARLGAALVALFALLAIPLVSLSPVLVSQSGLRYRTLIPLSVLFPVFAYLAAAWYARGVIDRLERLRGLAILGLISPLAALSAFNITTMNVSQHAQELTFMRHTLARASEHQACTDHAHFILPLSGGRNPGEWFVPARKKLPTDEFYHVASVYGREDNPMPAIWNTVYDLEGLPPPARITVSRPGEPFEPTECTVVFDMPVFTRSLVW
jgi:hypothetical protein